MKKKILMVLLLSIMFFPIYVNALTGKVILTCDDAMHSDNTLNCLISGSGFSAPISSFHGEISLGDGLTLVSVTKDSSWEGSGEDGVIDLYTGENKIGKVNFVSFIVKNNNKNNGNIIIKVEDITISDDDFKEYNFDVVTKEIKVSNVTNNNVNDVNGNGNFDSSNNKDTEVNNENANNEIIEDNEDVDTDDVLEQDNNVDKDTEPGSNWLVILLLIGAVVIICVIIFLRKRGRNV